MLGGLGCKGLSTEERQAIAPVYLEYWTVFDDVDEVKKLINSYAGPRSYLSVNIKQLREDELYPRFIEALAEDRGPDIISVSNRMLPAYRSKLASMPSSVPDATVRTVKKKLGTEIIVTESTQQLPSVRQIKDEYVQAVEKDVIYNDQIYGLPLSLETMALYYNKDLLDRAGIPEAPKTWSDFQSAVKKLTKYDKDNNIIQSGTALGTGDNIPGFDDLLFLLFEQSGVDFVNSNGYITFGDDLKNSAKLTAIVAVMDFYTDYANPKRDTYSWDSKMDNALNKFVNGSLAFFFGYSYHNSIIKSRAPQLNVEIMPMFQLDQSKSINATNFWVQTVVKKSKNQDEAWGLINYLTHSAATKTYLDNTKRPTAIRTYITGQTQDVKLKPFVSQALVAESWYKGRGYTTAKKALASMVDEWIKVPETAEKKSQWYKGILERGSSKINQSL